MAQIPQRKNEKIKKPKNVVNVLWCNGSTRHDCGLA